MNFSTGYISDFLGVPVSTVRRWADRFAAFLSPQDPAAGRHRSYNQNDLDTFRQIRDLASKGNSLKTIINVLSVIDHPSKENNQGDQAPAPGAAAQDTSGAGSALIAVGLSKEIGSHSAQITALQLQIDRLNDWRVKFLEYQALPWYIKLFKRPPLGY